MAGSWRPVRRLPVQAVATFGFSSGY